jgi:hypothetical protein
MSTKKTILLANFGSSAKDWEFGIVWTKGGASKSLSLFGMQTKFQTPIPPKKKHRQSCRLSA